MAKIINQCPSCDGTALNIVKIKCTSCQTQFEGNFKIPLLDKLDEKDVAFVVDFVKSSGSLKDMGRKLDVSYPTLRNRLNQLIDKIEALENTENRTQLDILDSLEKGKITVADAITELNLIEANHE